MRKTLVVWLIPVLFLSVFVTRTAQVKASTASAGVSWIKYPQNPLQLGVDGAAEPCVVCDGHMFKMWYSGRASDGLNQIYYATSPDGFSWTPHGVVLELGVSGSWEGLSLNRPVVLFDGSVYRMWYAGYSHDPFPAHRIGFANSTDGVVWRKYELNPVLVPGENNGWDDGGLGEFTVIFEQGRYVMWYNGQSVMHSTLCIGMATSVDGIHWTKYSGNPVMSPGPSAWDSVHIYTGPVIRNATRYLMWYSGQESNTVRIGLATSPDGVSWSKCESNPVVDVGPAGAWDSAGVFSGAVLEKDGMLFMWYYGFPDPSGSGGTKIGLATTGPLITWEYTFEDARRGTKLKISTDDKLFQFIAPDKNFGVKYDPKMYAKCGVIVICYGDNEMRLSAVAVDGSFDFCSAIAYDKQTRRTYLLIDLPNRPCNPCQSSQL